MTASHIYQYAVLRYVHDPLTQEFINVGIVLYSRDQRYLRALINSNYGRLSEAFQQINGPFYRVVANAIERQIAHISGEWESNNWIEQPPQRIEDILSQVLPPDDSSLVFGGTGGGLTADCDRQLNDLYGRLVLRYTEKAEVQSRDDVQVWAVFQREFDRAQILEQLQPVSIVTETFTKDFEHAWKNERWHPIEAVSFDLVKAGSIADKAHRWIGHALALKESSQLGKIYFLLGKPQHPELFRAYENAIADMSRQIDYAVLVREEDAGRFSEELAHEIAMHNA